MEVSGCLSAQRRLLNQYRILVIIRYDTFTLLFLDVRCINHKDDIIRAQMLIFPNGVKTINVENVYIPTASDRP